MEKPNVIEKAQQSIVRAQSAVARCRAALERAKDITVQRRAEYETLRASTKEGMVRTRILATASVCSQVAQAEETDQLVSADEDPAQHA